MQKTWLTWVFLVIAVVSTTAALWRLSQPASPQHEEVAKAFLDAIDANQDGVVSEREFTLVSTRSVPFSMVDIDEDGEGTIDFEEFFNWIMRLKKMKNELQNHQNSMKKIF